MLLFKKKKPRKMPVFKETAAAMQAVVRVEDKKLSGGSCMSSIWAWRIYKR